ncbi:MAG: NAD(P)/FAD-dependent oxidoreductase [Heteroscytonema crispum UTEX LB 1556]
MNDNLKKYDVVVIGAGAVGLSVAYELVQESLKVALVSPQNPRGVASLAAGAMIDAFGEISDLHSEYERQRLQVEIKAQKIYPEWLAGISERSGREIFHRKGLFMVTNRDGQFDKKRIGLIKEQLAAYGEKFKAVDPSEVPGLKPNYQYPVHEALFIEDALSVDTTDLLTALELAVANSGYCQRIHDAANTVEPQGDAWQVHTQNSDTLQAQRVVVCAGAHSITVIGEPLRLKAQLPRLFFGRGTSFTVVDAPDVPYTIRTPNRVLACGLHLVPRANNRLYIGGTNWFGTNLSVPNGPSVLEAHSLLDATMNQLNTSLAGASIQSVNWGLRPVTTYDRPIVGETELPGLFVATGTHRTGVHLSPILAKLISAELLGKELPYENIFLPNTKPEKTSDRDYDLAMRGLLAVAIYPTGGLPYNRLDEMQTFIREIFKLAVNDNGNEELRQKLQYWLEEIPPTEQSLLRIYNEVRERYLSDAGPHMS